MIIFLASLLYISQGYHGFEVVRVTQQKEYEAQFFIGIITVIPHSKNILFWKCDNQDFPSLKFSLYDQGYILQYSDFENDFVYESYYNYPTIKFKFKKEEYGQLIIQYLSFKDAEYGAALQRLIERYINEEDNIDWTQMHNEMEVLKNYLDWYCKQHIQSTKPYDQVSDL